VQEFLKKNGVTASARPLPSGPQVRGRGKKGSRFDLRSAQNKFADTTDDFVEFANHYISQCRPHQPDLQMSRFTNVSRNIKILKISLNFKWFVYLNQKLISKSNHLDASARGGFEIFKLGEEKS